MSIIQRMRRKARPGRLVSRTRPRRLSAEALETRRLLAGDVDIFTRRGDLFVIGDRADNSVELRVESSGNLVAVGLDGTTVNGESGPVTISETGIVEDDLRIRLGNGDDTILIDGVIVNDDLIANGGGGDDSIGMLRTNVGDDAAIYGLSGELDFSLDLSVVEDDLRVVGSRQDDTIVFDGSTVGDDTTVLTSSGDDTIVVLNSIHEDTVLISTGRGDDFVAVQDTKIGDDVRVFLGSGDDALAITDSSLGDRVLAFGGWGRDSLTLENVELNSRRTPLIFSFGAGEVENLDETVNSAIAELVDSGARRPTLVDIATSSEDFSILVSLLIQADLLGAVSGTDPLTVFAPTNGAFAAFLDETGLLFEDGQLLVPTEDGGTAPIDTAALQSVLLFHVVAGNVDSGAVSTLQPITTLQGGAISVELDPTDPIGLELDERANLLAVDVRARNGIVHVIDAVLTPPADPPEEPS